MHRANAVFKQKTQFVQVFKKKKQQQQLQLKYSPYSSKMRKLNYVQAFSFEMQSILGWDDPTVKNMLHESAVRVNHKGDTVKINRSKKEV